MSRSRNIKPGFFRNEVLVELPFEYRLLYIGTWTVADREGRFEDRPQKIKMELFPADTIDVDAGLQALHDKGFLLRYSVAGVAYCQILAFSRHQNPHHREQASTIPAPGKPEACPRHDQDKPSASRADSLIPDSLIPDSLIPDSLIPDSLIPDSKALDQQADRSTAKQAERFDDFWTVYPKKVAKVEAIKAWQKLGLDESADEIVEAVRRRSANDPQWQDRQFVPHPATFLRGRRWKDEWTAGRRKPAANDQFRDTVYTGTPIHALPPSLRVRLENDVRNFDEETNHVD